VLWSTPITRLPAREKIASPLREFGGRIIAVTTGYFGDRPPYQGHVAILDAQSGELLHVWNSLCSGQPRLLVPSECASAKSGIWGRAGAVIDPASGNIFVATGNGPYDGNTDWGDSTVQLEARRARRRGAAQGHERQIISTPSGGMLFTAPAVWHDNGTTWMFVAGGRIALPEGNANKHATFGVLDIWSVATPK
jgi:hypothetical protein